MRRLDRNLPTMMTRFACLLLLVAIGCARHSVIPKNDASTPEDATDAALVDATDATDATDAELEDASDAAPHGGECVPASTDCVGRVPRLCTAERRFTPGRVCNRACHDGKCVRCRPGEFLSNTWGPSGPLTILRCSDAYTWVLEDCASSGQCGPGWLERPADCAAYTAPECGVTGDGLGGLTDCDLLLGGCPSGFSCGEDTNANTCVGDAPSATEECAPGTDDCTGPVPRRCSRAGKWLPLLPGERCGTPTLCVNNGYDCGTTNDQVIGMIDCGTCPAGYVCGRFAPNHCAPEPLTTP